MASYKAPTVSINQLSEYLTAGPSRRKSIIKESRETKPFIVKTYNQASKAISRYLTNYENEPHLLSSEIDRLYGELKDTHPEWEKQNIRLCVEALERFQLDSERLNLGKRSIRPANVGPNSLLVEGVKINISPEGIVFEDVDGQNQPRAGLLKCHFSKTKKLTSKRANYIGAILHWYSEEHLSNVGQPDYRASMIVDVQNDMTIRIAPKGQKRSREDIADACSEIADRWGTV